MSEKKHMELGPSSAERWFNCPGSVAALRGVKRTESEYAREGTAAHELLEQCLTQRQHPELWIGDEVLGYKVDDGMAEAVGEAYDYILGRLEEAGPAAILFVERYVKVIDGLVEGTLDAAIVVPFESVEVIDYKHGRGVAVDAEENKQMLLYTLGIVRELEVYDIKQTIIQPRVKEGDRISSWDVPEARLESFRQELDAAVARVRDPKAPQFGGPWCAKSFCELRTVCQAKRQHLAGALAVKGPEKIFFPAAETLSVEQLAKILDHKEDVEKWLTGVAAYAQQLAEDGIELPGYGLEPKRSNRAWIDEVMVETELHQEYGDDIYERKLLSPAKMEKKVGKERVAELCHKPNNGMTLKKLK